MNSIYWISVIIAVVSFGGMSKSGRGSSILDRLWIPLYIIAYIVAILNSRSILTGIITAALLFFGNGLLWGIVWRHKLRQK